MASGSVLDTALEEVEPGRRRGKTSWELGNVEGEACATERQQRMHRPAINRNEELERLEVEPSCQVWRPGGVGSRKLSAVSQGPQGAPKACRRGKGMVSLFLAGGGAAGVQVPQGSCCQHPGKRWWRRGSWVIETDGSNRFLGQTARAW